jgi:hypothetical protein
MKTSPKCSEIRTETNIGKIKFQCILPQTPEMIKGVEVVRSPITGEIVGYRRRTEMTLEELIEKYPPKRKGKHYVGRISM